MNTPDNNQVNKLPQHPIIYSNTPPLHWTSSVVHCDKKPNKQPNKQTQIKTCKIIKTFFLQYY